MLTLPTDWRLFHGGAVALDLFRQVPQSTLQTEFARHLIGADLELAIAEIFRHKHPPLLVEGPSEFSWRIRDFSWVYLSEIDDSALAKAIELASHSVTVTLIVPPKHGEIFSRLSADSERAHAAGPITRQFHLDACAFHVDCPEVYSGSSGT